MTTDMLLDAIGGTNDELLAVCDHIPPRKHTARNWVAAAACVVLTAAAVVAALRGARLPAQPDSVSTTLPAAVSESETSALPQNEIREETGRKTSTTAPDTTAKDGMGVTAPPVMHLPAQSDPAFYPNESTTYSRAGSGRVYDGSVETPQEGVDSASRDDALWNRAPITSKYPYMQWNGQTYASRGRAELSGQVQEQILGTAVLQGFDGVPSHKTTVKILPIRGVAQEAAAAVQFEGNSAYYAYVCKTYAPRTLGQLTDDLSLWSNISITGANGCGGELAATAFSAPEASEVRKLLDCAAPLDMANKLRPATVTIGYSLPLLGETPGSMELTADGDLIVHFCESELVYHVGKARATAFIDYLNRNCHPKKLGEQTTAAYTVPPREE